MRDDWVRGDWIQTFTGRKFHPLDPRPEDIDIDDIAHALSMQCRYGGHSLRFYSVAEHCVHLSNWFEDREMALVALMHDAAEAYLVDVPRPIKKQLAGYLDIERGVEKVIFARYGLPYPIHEAVKAADTRILMDESAVLMRKPSELGSAQCEPLGIQVRCWRPEQAKEEFLACFYGTVFAPSPKEQFYFGWTDLA